MSKKFAVFDIDGTLIRWQLYHTIVDKLAKAGYLGETSWQIIHDARMSWKRRENNATFRAYEVALIEEFEKALQNIKTHTFDNLAKEVIEEYKDQTYTYTKTLAQELKAKGYTLLAISGSHAELVTPLAEYYGFDDFVATVYERSGESFTGEKFVGSFDKKAALELLVKKHGLDFAESYAVGDSHSDAAMLKMVEHPIAFNPDEALFKVAAENSWNIVVERKNMIYNLEPTNGSYILAKTGE